MVSLAAGPQLPTYRAAAVRWKLGHHTAGLNQWPVSGMPGHIVEPDHPVRTILT